MEQTAKIMHRFPKFELSYETIPHKKVSPNYNIALAIPYGRKFYVWFTFIGTQNVCILMELNREKRITKTEIINTNTLYDPSLALGTILYGAIEEKTQTTQQSFFVIEDIFYFRGLSTKSMPFMDRLGYMCQTLDLLNTLRPSQTPVAAVKQVIFCAPAMIQIDEPAEYVPTFHIMTPGQTAAMAYTPHHMQYRCLTTIEPYLNISTPKINLGPVVNTSGTHLAKPVSTYKPNYSKPQYKTQTVFIAMADLQCDIYRLYAYGSNRSLVYYGLAAIPNYHTSVLMNGIFRKIKENRNLDFIEESDDEDEFENTDETRFVDLEKWEFIECSFHAKFKKWVPIRVVKQGHLVVHISKL